MLYLVATPIGNLGDITLRALEVLREVDFVASEDTRKTGMLLKHFDLQKKQFSLREHNERQATQRVIALLEEGKKIALVTDAGTPGISDPGFILVREVVQAGLKVTMIPGASAHVMALALSGLPMYSFCFRGFAPPKSGARRRFLEVDLRSPHTLIFYESPHRLVKFLEDALVVYGDRRAAVANDLTKLFESVERGLLSELIAFFNAHPPRGEYTVVIEGLDKKALAALDEEDTPEFDEEEIFVEEDEELDD